MGRLVAGGKCPNPDPASEYKVRYFTYALEGVSVGIRIGFVSWLGTTFCPIAPVVNWHVAPL